MTREDFWERWNWAFCEYRGDPTPEELKKEMFEDLDALCEAYLQKHGPCMHSVNMTPFRPVVYEEVPDELLYKGHLWHSPAITDYCTGMWVCSLCGCDSDEPRASKKCTGGVNEYKD